MWLFEMAPRIFFVILNLKGVTWSNYCFISQLEESNTPLPMAINHCSVFFQIDLFLFYVTTENSFKFTYHKNVFMKAIVIL